MCVFVCIPRKRERKSLTVERSLASDATRTNLGHADLADVISLGNEWTARQRTVKVQHVDLVVTYSIAVSTNQSVNK